MKVKLNADYFSASVLRVCKIFFSGRSHFFPRKDSSPTFIIFNDFDNKKEKEIEKVSTDKGLVICVFYCKFLKIIFSHFVSV